MINRIKEKLYRALHRPTGEIWVLHRVLERPDESCFAENRNLSITAGDLESLILEYRGKGYEFVSLDYASRIQKEGRGPRYVCVTFDDGYLDNLTVACPLLTRLEVPFTVFVVTDFIERKAHLWWYWIEELRKKDPSVSFGALHDEFIAIHPDEMDDYMDSKYPDYKAWNSEKLDSLALNESQLKELSDNPLCTIGIHTRSHCRLDLLDRNVQYSQISDAKSKLEAIVGKPMEHLSYPYGAHNGITEEICRKLGLKSALLAWGGPMRKSESLINGRREKK